MVYVKFCRIVLESKGLGLGDDVVGDVFRARGVVAEFHGELAAAGGHGAEVADHVTDFSSGVKT